MGLWTKWWQKGRKSNEGRKDKMESWKGIFFVAWQFVSNGARKVTSAERLD